MSEEILNRGGGEKYSARYVQLSNIRASGYIAINELAVKQRDGTNIALTASVTASSYLDASRSPAKIADDIINSVWHAGNTGINWVRLDFGIVKSFSRIEIYPITYDAQYTPYQWDLYIGNDLASLDLMASGRTRLPAGWSTILD